MSEPTSTKPYLIRAIYEWCTDNGFTPYLAVLVDEETVVPREYVKNGEIVLNISALATSRLSLGNEFVDFQARFGGVARSISVPIKNVGAIYARENGQGMAFDSAKDAGQGHDLIHASPPALTKPAKAPTERPTLSSVSQESTADKPDSPDDGPKGKPRLKIVK